MRICGAWQYSQRPAAHAFTRADSKAGTRAVTLVHAPVETRCPQIPMCGEPDGNDVVWACHVRQKVPVYLRGMTLAQCYALEELHMLMEEVVRLCTEQGIPVFLATGMGLGGWGRVMQGQWEEGLAQLCQGITGYRATGSLNLISWGLGVFAEACWVVGQVEEGLAALTEAFAFVEETSERAYEAELWRLKGALTLLQENRNQKAKSKRQKAKGGNRGWVLLLTSSKSQASNPKRGRAGGRRIFLEGD